MGEMLPKGSRFQWTSGTFFATSTGLATGANTIRLSLKTRGIDFLYGISGGGGWIPSAAGVSATVKLLKPMGDAEARQLVEDAFQQTFKFLTLITSEWTALESGTVYVASDTKKQIEDGVSDAADSAKKAVKQAYVAELVLVSVIVIGLVSTAVIAAKLK